VRVSYDGQNGQAYVPIGLVLVDRGEMTLEQVSMQTIRAWLVAHPKDAKGVMNMNPSYVFFRELTGMSTDAGPPGALGAPLSPMRSAAVDKNVIPLGAPIWIDTQDPLDGTKLQRLMMAQDLGGAIKGAIRTDIFFGWGRDAEERAGRMRQRGTEFVLLPKFAQSASAQ
jgi:membrane-bound lytic murein transglycosylase A